MKERERREETGPTTQVHHCNWSHCKEQAPTTLCCSKRQNIKNEIKLNILLASFFPPHIFCFYLLQDFKTSPDA